jgi:hypothetical protein
LKPAHRADLVWRFQRASEAVSVLPDDPDLRLELRERIHRIDRALAALPTSRVRLASVLSRRYGLAEVPADTRHVLRESAAVAELAPEAATELARALGRTRRRRSRDVREWLAALCRRIRAREAGGADLLALEEIRRGAEALVTRAERAYAAAFSDPGRGAR